MGSGASKNLQNSGRRKGQSGTARITSDVNAFYGEQSDSSHRSPVLRGPKPKMTWDEFKLPAYSMDHENRGMAIIINNKDFKDPRLDTRAGTEYDGIALYDVLHEIGFSVRVHENKTANEMVDILLQASKENDYHRNSDCFVCAILTHGRNGFVCGTVGEVALEKLVNIFKGNSCLGLVGKPKIFFIQACQGTKVDDGVAVDVADARAFMPREPSIEIIPIEADILIAQSSVPGYRAWRDIEEGSLFIQTLTKKLRKWWRSLDLLTILTRVNGKMAHKTLKTEKEMQIKTIPMIMSMLTKAVMFKGKE